MTVRDFAKVADFTSEYAHLSIYDPSGMIRCGYFNSFYELLEDNPILDYEIIRISGNFSIRIDINEDDAEKLRKYHEEFICINRKG